METSNISTGGGGSARVYRMTTSETDINNAWAELLDARPEPDGVPDGWMTCRDIAELQRARGVAASESTVYRKLKMLADLGRVERREFRVLSGGVVRPVPHYRVKGCCE